MLKLCELNKVKIIKTYNVRNFLQLICLDHCEAEKLFSENVSRAISNSGGEIILPNELKAGRSVILHRLDKIILENNIDQIKNELLKSNPMFTFHELIKIGKSDKMKIVFASSNEAEKCCKSGLFMFHLHVPTFNIELDKFVKLETCFHCYAVEKHSTSDCPTKLSNASFIVCSKCAVHGHDFKSCDVQSRDFKCLNCDGNHNAMAMACPLRKEALRLKRIDPPTKFSTRTKYSLNKETIDHNLVCKSFSLTLLAVLKCTESPGSFSDELNTLFSQNGLPILNLTGYVPPSISSIRGLFSENSSMKNGSEWDDTQKRNYEEEPKISSNSKPNQNAAILNSGTMNLRSTATSHHLSKPPSTTFDIDELNSQSQPSAWKGFKVMKPKGVNVLSMASLRSLWEAGEVLVVRETGNVPDYSTTSKLFDSGIIPNIQSMKKTDFKSVASSPKRFISKIK